MLVTTYALAQHTLNVSVKDKKGKEPMPGVVVHITGTAIGNVTDERGFSVLNGIPGGKQEVSFRIQGFKGQTDTVAIPYGGDTLAVYMEEDEEELEETVVSATRSSRTINDIPTRVETISGEELDEKANMKPGDIRMVLAESTGIQTLQTSATSANSSIRIQGMDGRYTQILKDGLPLYAGFAGGLGLLQTPPLNLKRVEIIKGASSTLYGGGAIAGLVNLVSKTPKEERELRFMLNGTSGKGLDVNGYYGQKFGKAGLTIYGAYDANAAYAPAGQVFTAIPKFTRYTFSPKLFLYLSPKTELSVGINTSFEDRVGGDIKYITGAGDTANTYYERNKTERVSSELELSHKFSAANMLKVKNSVSKFHRYILSPATEFDGNQTSSFTEISYASVKEKNELVGGINLFTDAFSEKQLMPVPLRNYHLVTAGAFFQHTHNFNKHLILEAGMRGDHVFNYGFVLLPRLSLLYKANEKLSSRLGGGMGYKAPTIFTEETERILYNFVLPINADNKLERSYGGNWDANYKTSLADGAIRLSINQLFFYTRVYNPLVLGYYRTAPYSILINQEAHIDAKGAETNVKLSYKDFKLFLGYTYTHSHLHSNGIAYETPLTPRHRTNSVLMYEVDEKWKIGLEAYYFSPVKLSDGTTGRDYWLCGAMAERIWKHFSVFINFENILDSRQTRFGQVNIGTQHNPYFRDLYAPLEGFIVNGGIKLAL